MTATERLTMPAPPAGMVWVLQIDATRDDAALWLYRERLIHKGEASTHHVRCSVLPDIYAPHGCLRISTATTTRIVKVAIMTAWELIEKVNGHDERETQAQARADEISAQLGIEVRVHKR